MIPKTKPRPKREDFKFYDQYSAAVMAWKKSSPKAGATKTTKTRKGSKYITTTLVWNGSRWVKKGDSSLVPSRAGKNEGNTTENKKLKIKAQYEKDKKIPKVTGNGGSGNGGTTNNGGTTKNGGTKTSGVGPVKDGKTYAKNLKNTTQGVGPVKDGATYGKNLTKKVAEKPKVVEKKQPKLIRKKKR